MTIMPLSDSEMVKFIKVASATVSDMVQAQISGPMDKPIVESGTATVAMAEAHTFGRTAVRSSAFFTLLSATFLASAYIFPIFFNPPFKS